MMPKKDTSDSTSATEGDVKEHSVNELKQSGFVPDAHTILETEEKELCSAPSSSEKSQQKETAAISRDVVGGFLYPEGDGSLQEPYDMLQSCCSPKNNSCGTNGNVSEYVIQEQSESSGHVEHSLSAESVSDDEDQMCSDGMPSQKDQNLILRDLGISSTTFIGPLFKPQEPKTKADIENELSEFYKELEEMKPEKGDCIDGNTKKNTEKNSTTATNIPQNPSLCEQKSFSNHRENRPYHGLHSYRNDHSNHWRPKRQRSSFQQTRKWPGPEQAYYPDQWQHTQAFRGPQCPPYHSLHRHHYHGPPHPPPPLPPPPPPHPPPFYSPEFGPLMTTYHDYPDYGNHFQWKGSQFPPGPGYPSLNDFGGYDALQDYGSAVCPPDGFDSCGDNEGTCSNPYDCSDWVHGYDPEQNQLQQYHQQEGQSQVPYSDCDYHPDPLLILILMRGVPGSGKSTLARKLLASGPNGLILSTDDYFSEDNGYSYNPSLIGDAHEWNQNRAREAMDDGCSPVIIDNTNLQAWEMKPYVEMALERGYSINFQEPDTSWKLDPFELEKRNNHGVPSRKISQMLERFELPMSVDIVLKSRDPPHKSAERPPSQHLPRY
ncbi:hypothetical protein AGOR_G00125300 [Albula goreensis]|uniref:NEDD4-binding protein 2-like 2 n=1 Tax=Albula goreensis TaxID=1534307 RepID=A0A8T3D9X9_9TELE|nr:hypothetical protein AGOR_G00125300 [Albula goreensis]